MLSLNKKFKLEILQGFNDKINSIYTTLLIYSLFLICFCFYKEIKNKDVKKIENLRKNGKINYIGNFFFYILLWAGIVTLVALNIVLFGVL